MVFADVLDCQADEQNVIDRIVEKIEKKKIPNMVYPYTFDKIRYIIDNIKAQIARIPARSEPWNRKD
jgi:hypothetical protein